MNFLANTIDTHWMGCYPGYGSMTKIILLNGKKKLLSSILVSSVCNKKKKIRTWHSYIPRNLGKWYTWRIYLIFQTTSQVFTTARSLPTALSWQSFNAGLLLPTGPWTLLASKPEQALQRSFFSLSGEWAAPVRRCYCQTPAIIHPCSPNFRLLQRSAYPSHKGKAFLIYFWDAYILLKLEILPLQ